MEENIPYSIQPPKEDKQEAAEIGIIRELGSSTKVLHQLRMELKGYSWDYDQEKWIKIRDPLMNDKGIGKYLSIISAVVTDLVTFSNYSQDEINPMVEYVCEKSIPVIHINYRDYGIKEKSDLDIIDVQIVSLTKAALHKAMCAGDRNVVRGTVSEQMMSRYGAYPVQEKRGFLSKINPFSKE
jgi:hypothetical protein